MIFLHGMSVGIILNHYISNDIPLNPKKSYGPMNIGLFSLDLQLLPSFPGLRQRGGTAL